MEPRDAGFGHRPECASRPRQRSPERGPTANAVLSSPTNDAKSCLATNSLTFPIASRMSFKSRDNFAASSYRNHLGQNPSTDVGLQRIGQNQVNTQAEQIAQFVLDLHQPKQPRIAMKRHEQVEITVRPPVPPNARAKDPKRRNTMPRRKTRQMLTQDRANPVEVAGFRQGSDPALWFFGTPVRSILSQPGRPAESIDQKHAAASPLSKWRSKLAPGSSDWSKGHQHATRMSAACTSNSSQYTFGHVRGRLLHHV